MNNFDTRRITLVARHSSKPPRDWDFSNPMGSRLIFVDALSFLPFAIDQGIKLGQDVDRVIIDRTGTAEQYLQLLASLPQDFLGDVLYARGDGDGFLSSVGRGGNRVLYSLSAEDIVFYLGTLELVWDAPAMAPEIEQLAIA